MLPLKQTQAVISTYAADVSGVCSALYELGGMTVMHDASGCNSTYNTHDEPRWYDRDSLVFISALSEMEAIMGDDEKLISDITETALNLNPAFIAIAGTPIPTMTGCDIPAVARAVEHRTGIPSFGFNTNGMRSYAAGAGEALCAYAERFVKDADKKIKNGVNVLGVTPLDFSVNGSEKSISEVLCNAGFKVIGTWAMGCAPQELECAACAEVNLAVSASGIETAKYFFKKYGIPYVVGTPYGGFADTVVSSLKKAVKTGRNIISFADFIPDKNASAIIIGESVMSRSLAAAVYNNYGIKSRVICPLEKIDGILSENDIYADAEIDIENALLSATAVTADPLYKPIVKRGCKFYPLAHEAFSGRIFRKNIPNLINFKKESEK